MDPQDIAHHLLGPPPAGYRLEKLVINGQVITGAADLHLQMAPVNWSPAEHLAFLRSQSPHRRPRRLRGWRRRPASFVRRRKYWKR